MNKKKQTCPPMSHTVNAIFLYCTVSTLNPIVGTVETVSFNRSLYNIVVFPALSSPTINMRTSGPPNSFWNPLMKKLPMSIYSVLKNRNHMNMEN